MNNENRTPAQHGRTVRTLLTLILLAALLMLVRGCAAPRPHREQPNMAERSATAAGKGT